MLIFGVHNWPYFLISTIDSRQTWKRTNGGRLEPEVIKRTVEGVYINRFVPSAPFFYPLKTSENLTVF